MTARSEKPSATESSTDTLIGALETIAKVLDQPQGGGLYTKVLLEAAQRLDKLEKELDQLRQTKTLRDEFAMAYIGGDSDWPDIEKLVRAAYETADAMIEARK